MRTSTTLLLFALATLPGCACDTVPPDAVQDCSAAVVPGAVATDILFVIDDSQSMGEEQTNLRNNLEAFVQGLLDAAVANDFRIGVTSTSVEGFAATATSGQSYPCTGTPCLAVPYPDGAIVAVQQDAAGNGLPGALDYDASRPPATGGWGGARFLDGASATLLRDFSANVQLGTSGSGREQPFRAARLALSDRLLDANQGFLRPGARLAVIFLTDEDDCSGPVSAAVADNAACENMANKANPALLTDPAELAAFLTAPLDGEVRDVSVGVIAGLAKGTLAPSCGQAWCRTADQSCSTAYDKADRFTTLLGAMGSGRVRLGSICDASFADTLRGFAESLMPQTLPLAGAPADWHMLVVSVLRKDGSQVRCVTAAAGSPAAATADAVYSPPGFGQPAQVAFQGACTLQLGDRIDLQIVCAN